MFELIAMLLIWGSPAPFNQEIKKESIDLMNRVGSENFEERLEAKEELEKYWKNHLPALFKKYDDYEIKFRIEKILESKYYYKIGSIRLVPLGTDVNSMLFKSNPLTYCRIFGCLLSTRKPTERNDFEKEILAELRPTEKYPETSIFYFNNNENMYISRKLMKRLQLMGYKEEFIKAMFAQ